MRKFLETLAAIGYFMIMFPVCMALSLFCEEDPADSYKMQNW